MPFYRATFETCLYKKHSDGTHTLTDRRHDGTRLFTELSRPHDWEFYHFHPKPPRPRSADFIMYTTAIDEYNPVFKRWDIIQAESY